MNRQFKERIIRASLGMITLTACLLLVFILATVLWKGLPALKISFLLEESRDFGKSGGILYQALGTLLLMAGAVVLCLPVALGSVLFQTEFLHSAAIKKIPAAVDLFSERSAHHHLWPGGICVFWFVA